MIRHAALVVILAAPVQAWAGGTNSANFFVGVPTLDEVGLGVLIALVAGIAGWAVRRRSRR
jgi:hypothetical protein